mmetsp:Transcript_79918/g.226036  ORF Transcript_79918/g.226036 Transcript_79918/m.226036 type:complete len:251 (+) Transcript_79918:408-1160(+)
MRMEAPSPASVVRCSSHGCLSLALERSAARQSAPAAGRGAALASARSGLLGGATRETRGRLRAAAASARRSRHSRAQIKHRPGSEPRICSAAGPDPAGAHAGCRVAASMPAALLAPANVGCSLGSLKRSSCSRTPGTLPTQGWCLGSFCKMCTADDRARRFLCSSSSEGFTGAPSCLTEKSFSVAMSGKSSQSLGKVSLSIRYSGGSSCSLTNFLIAFASFFLKEMTLHRPFSASRAIAPLITRSNCSIS